MIVVPSSRFVALLFTFLMVMEMSPPPPALVTEEDLRWLLMVLPPFSFVLLLFLYAAVARLLGCKPQKANFCIFAALAVGMTAAEIFLMPPQSKKLGVVFYKYCWIRFLLEAFDGIAAHECGGCALRWLHDACRLWALSWRWARDMIMGLALTTFIYMMAVIPGFHKLQGYCLFHTKAAKESAPALQRKGTRDGGVMDSSAYSLNPDQEENEALLNFFRNHAPQLVPQLATR
jgi:hypothetical protein